MYVDISGIDLDLGLKEYVRRYIPLFVTERTLADGCREAEKLRIMKAVNLPCYDRFEIMCRTHGTCADNYQYVSRTPDKIVDIDALKGNKIRLEDIYDVPPDDFDYRDYGWLDEPIVKEDFDFKERYKPYGRKD